MSWSTSLIFESATRAFTTTDFCTSAQAEIVEGIEMEGKSGLDRDAAFADIANQHRLEHHDFAVKVAENRDALGITPVHVGHAARNIARPASLGTASAWQAR